MGGADDRNSREETSPDLTFVRSSSTSIGLASFSVVKIRSIERHGPN